MGIRAHSLCTLWFTEPQHLHYFNVEGDDAHRIPSAMNAAAIFARCSSRMLCARFSHEVEEVVTAKLDALPVTQSSRRKSSIEA